jgi:hypothetical protein
MPKSTRNRGTGRVARRGRGSAMEAVETLTRPSQSLPVVIALCLWRWRWELLTLATITYIAVVHGTEIVSFFNDTVPVWFTIVLVVLAAGWLVVDNPARRFARNRVWCVITRHRVRACLTEMRTLNWSGNLPFILGCFATKTGQVVWLWMRPGLSAEDLDNKSETLASACWARSAVITRSQRNAALVRIDIDRRDPLSKKHIVSPLLNDTSDMPEAAVADDAVLAFITPETVPDESTSQLPAKTGSGETRTKTTRTKTTAAVNDGATVILGANGEDVSDYV